MSGSLVRVIACVALFASMTASVADEALMERSGCISCHRVDQKLIGPAFRDVAARYRSRSDAADYLAGRIRGGSEEEIWGDLSMPPNTPERISDDNLKLVVDWILSL